jgi:hypothetical protein
MATRYVGERIAFGHQGFPTFASSAWILANLAVRSSLLITRGRFMTRCYATRRLPNRPKPTRIAGMDRCHNCGQEVVEIDSRGGKVPFTEEQLSEIRGGLTVEEYRWKLTKQTR